MTDLKQLLTILTETPGPSGDEGRVASALRAQWDPYVDECVVDRMGSLIATRRGQGPAPRRRLVLAAHADEIGLMVKAIVTNRAGHAFLKVTPVGGADKRQLYGQAVVVHGRQGGDHELQGLIVALPAGMQRRDYAGKAFDYEALLVDVGLAEAELRARVAVGDFISFEQPLRSLQGKRVAGKALDNRVSLAAITVCLEALSRREHAWDVVAVATSQEETRLLGAVTSGHALMPDIAVAIDVTFGAGPGTTGPLAYDLGKGPTIGFGPNVHPTVQKALEEAADRLEMTVHLEPHARQTGTDAAGYVISRAGIPTGLVGLPLRYMHTMVESVDLRDVERAGRLLAEFAATLDDRLLEQMQRDLLDEKKS
jgi:endoglucanase